MLTLMTGRHDVAISRPLFRRRLFNVKSTYFFSTGYNVVIQTISEKLPFLSNEVLPWRIPPRKESWLHIFQFSNLILSTYRVERGYICW